MKVVILNHISEKEFDDNLFYCKISVQFSETMINIQLQILTFQTIILLIS